MSLQAPARAKYKGRENKKMQKLYVDLRSYPPDEAERIYRLIYNLSFDTYSVAEMPHVYEVMWDREISVSDAANIPKHLVTFYLPHNN